MKIVSLLIFACMIVLSERCVWPDAPEIEPIIKINAGDLDREYIRSISIDYHSNLPMPATDSAGWEYFSARKQNLDQPPNGNILYKYNPSTQELIPLKVKESGESSTDNMFSISVDDAGKRLAGIQTTKPPATRICVLDLDAGVLNIVIDDGQRNSRAILSPDGRFIAYYSTDPIHGSGDLRNSHSCRVIDVELRKIFIIAEPFATKSDQWYLQSPLWRGSQRVLFSTLSSDLGFMRKHDAAEPNLVQWDVGRICPYLVVASWEDDRFKMKYRFFPGKDSLVNYIQSDGSQDIYINYVDPQNGSSIIQLDVNLEAVRDVVKLGEGQYFQRYWIEGDTLKYTYWTGVGRERTSDSLNLAPVTR